MNFKEFRECVNITLGRKKEDKSPLFLPYNKYKGKCAMDDRMYYESIGRLAMRFLNDQIKKPDSSLEARREG